MIHESFRWKNKLLKLANRLAGRAVQRRWTDATFENVEADIFLSAFIARKLNEARKISTSNIDCTIKIKKYPALGGIVHKFNKSEIDELYNLQKAKIEIRKIDFILNQIIHSFVFEFNFSRKNKLYAIMVSSDLERNKFLYEIRIIDLIKYLRRIGKDFPNIHRGIYDENKHDWKMWQEIYPEVKVKAIIKDYYSTTKDHH